jgi:hypothetical protein
MLRDVPSLADSPTQILDAIRKSSPGSTLILWDIYNLLASIRVEELVGQTPIEWLQVFPLLLVAVEECR